MWSWKTAFFPTELPEDLSLWYYVFGANDTHVALPLGYGSVVNHHEFANVEHAWSDDSQQSIMFAVREFCIIIHISM